MMSGRTILGECPREPILRKGRASSFAAAAAAGLMALSGCQNQSVQLPPVIGVKELLRQPPMGLRQENNEPGAYALSGKAAACRGVQVCTVEVNPGDLLLNVKIEGEAEANLEITVSSMGGGSVVLQRRQDSNSSETVYDTQTVNVGQSSALFNTDMSVSAVKGENGRFYITLQ